MNMPNVRETNALLPSPWVASAKRWVTPLIAPIACGWFAFVILTSVGGLLPQTIRISTLGEYDPYLDDYIVFQGAGRLLWSDKPADVYDVTSVHSEQAKVLEVAPESIIPLPFFGPPQTLPAFALLGLEGRVSGAVIWTAGSVALFFVGCGFLRHLSGAPLRSATTLAVFLGLASSMPAYEVVLHGQMSFLLVVGLLLFFHGSIHKRDAAIAALGVALLLTKPQIALMPAGFVLATRQWRVLLGVVALHGTALAVSVAAFGGDIVPSWVRLMVEASTWEDKNGIWVHAMFGWNGFIRALMGPDMHLARQAVVLLLSAGTVGGAVWVLRYRNTSKEVKLLVLTASGILISPHLFAQDLILIGVPLALLCLQQSSDRSMWILYGLSGWALTLAHFPWLFPDPDELALNFVTLWVFGALVISGIQAWRALPRCNLTLPEAAY